MPSPKKIALVTGSARGIGKAIAQSLLRRSITVLLNGLPADEPLLSQLAGEMKTGYFVADVSREREVGRLISSIEDRHGSIDILVSNAGMNRDGLVRDATLEDWSRVMEVNLTASFLLTKAVFPKMVETGWGRVIYISSILAKVGMRGTPCYSASKAALLGLCKAAASEVARKGVTVNAVCPGYVDTEMISHYPAAWREEICAKIPLRRFARPEEVSEVVAFLCQEEASYVTGTSIDVCGGLL